MVESEEELKSFLMRVKKESEKVGLKLNIQQSKIITLYARQKKRHRCIEQSFGLCGRRRGWDDLRIALKHVYYHMWNWSPVQVRCMRQGAQDWCTGMTQRDGMGREVGGGFRMGNSCTPMAYSCQCLAKPLQYCKVTSCQINKFILKNPMFHIAINQSI